MRRLLLFGLVVALAASSGCLGVIGQDELRYTAEPVATGEEAVVDAGFERRGSDSFEFDRTVEVGGQERRIVVTSHTVTLGKRYRGAPLGHVVALSTPKAPVLGQELNPLGRVGAEGLIERVLGRSSGGNLEDLERTGNLTVEALGAPRTVDRFDASGEGGRVQVFLARFSHGDDYVIVFAVIPDEADDGADAFRTVLGGVRHDAGGS